MAKLDDLVARLRLDSTDFDRKTKGVETQMGRLQRQATTTGNVFKGILGGAAAIGAVRGLTTFLRGGVNEFMEMEAAGAQTASVIRSTGGAAGVTASQVDKLASKIQGLTGIQDDQIVSAQNLLMTFTNISGADGMFERTTRAAVDMSVVFGTDLKSSAIQLGKALNDPIKGLTALSRVGVSFTAQQRDQIEALVDAGDTAGAQRVILSELERQVGGSAEAFGDTLAGKVEKAKRSIEDFQEGLASAVIPFIANTAIPTIERFWKAITGHREGGPSDFQVGLGRIRDFIGGATKDFRKGLATLDELFTNPTTFSRGNFDRLSSRFADINAAQARTPSMGIAKNLDALLAAGPKAVGVNRRVADSIEEVTTATDDQAEAAKRLTRAQRDLADAHRRVDDALFDLADAEDDLREAQFRQGSGSEEAIKAGRNVERARIRVADANANVADRVMAIAEANKVAAEAVAGGLTRMANAVDNLAKAGGLSPAGVAGVRSDLGSAIHITVNADRDADDIVEKLNRELDWGARRRAGRGGRAMV